jgi:hypothetical protein
MARCGLLLATTAVILAVAAPNAMAGQFASLSFGLAGTPGPNLPSHANQFVRDGLASPCGDTMFPGSPIVTPGPFAYKSHAFTNFINESLCVTVGVTAPTCPSATDPVMSETYSPAYDPNSITANWIGDLGDSPPAQASYQAAVPAGAKFETVVDEVSPSANCGGVNVTWSSDRPFANARPFVSGLAAVGQTLTRGFEIWSGNPAVVRQWKRCDAAGGSCLDIPGATGQSYVPTDDDIGHTIRIDESATENGLTSTVDGRATATPVFIPAATHEGQSLAPGDSAVSGHLNLTSTSSRCAAPKSAPTTSGNESRFYDTFTVTSLVNEPACVWFARIPGGFCSSILVLYSPTFVPADLRSNYAADDASREALSATLAPGTSAQLAIFDDGVFHNCSGYGLMIGSDAPFATGRPELAGGSTAGTRVTTTTGIWNGAPAFAYSWQRCDAGGGGCVPISGGATGPAYTPTGADVGSTLRARVTATRAGRSASSDSGPTGVIAADRTAPRGTIRLGSRSLAKIVKSGRVPLRVTCDEACSAAVQVRVTRKLAKALGLRRKTVIAKAKGSVRAGARKTLRGKLTARARRAMRRRISLKLSLAATFTDAAGNRAKQTRKGTLKRPTRRRH